MVNAYHYGAVASIRVQFGDLPDSDLLDSDGYNVGLVLVHLDDDIRDAAAAKRGRELHIDLVEAGEVRLWTGVQRRQADPVDGHEHIIERTSIPDSGPIERQIDRIAAGQIDGQSLARQAAAVEQADWRRCGRAPAADT